MTFKSTKWPSRSLVVNAVRVVGRWQGGGAASDMTRLTGRGVDSVKYNAATGAYIITFTDVGETFLGGNLQIGATAGTTATEKVVCSQTYSAANKTLTIFITDLATPTAKDLATTEELWIDLAWADSDAP